MCCECRFQVMEVDWNKGSWPRCIVEPTRLRRVFSVRVGVRAQKDALSRDCGDPFREEGGKCSQKGGWGRESITVPYIE